MHEKIVTYYNQCEFDYEWLWGLSRYHAIHYGYYDEQHTSHAQAVVNFNHVLAKIADIKSGDTVLDAGCGIGGSSLWLAEHLGCRVTGISIVPAQIDRARRLAAESSLARLAKFDVQDYNRTLFPDGSFTIIWGLESICYAQSKEKFLVEAWRLLKPGGRLIVADGFLNRRPESQRQQDWMAAWLNGWAVPNLAPVKSFYRDLENFGFKKIVFTDVTRHVMPSSKRMYRATLALYPLAKVLWWMGLRTEIQMNNMIAAYYQHLSLKKNLWAYGIFYAEKPRSLETRN